MEGMRARLTLFVVTVCVLAGAMAVEVRRATAQTTRPIVYVTAIEGTIDFGVAPFLPRTMREAGEADA
jgi:membrane-bound ClpP family serine protease